MRDYFTWQIIISERSDLKREVRGCVKGETHSGAWRGRNRPHARSSISRITAIQRVPHDSAYSLVGNCKKSCVVTLNKGRRNPELEPRRGDRTALTAGSEPDGLDRYVWLRRDYRRGYLVCVDTVAVESGRAANGFAGIGNRIIQRVAGRRAEGKMGFGGVRPENGNDNVVIEHERLPDLKVRDIVTKRILHEEDPANLWRGNRRQRRPDLDTPQGIVLQVRNQKSVVERVERQTIR